MDPRYEFVPEPAAHRRFMDESDLSFKAQRDQQLAHFVYDKTDSIRQQIDTLQKECETKNRTIDSLSEELVAAKERLADFGQQVKEYEENLAAQHTKNGNLLSRMQEDQMTIDKLKAQLATTNRKYSMAKCEFDHETELLKDQKTALEQNNMMLQMRVSVLDNDNRKQKEMIKLLQSRLELAVEEAKKNQNIAVSTSRAPQLSPSNTDAPFISAPDAGPAVRNAQESQLHVQIKEKSKSPSKSKVPQTPDAKNLQNFERLLMEGGDNETVRVQFVALKNDFTVQKQKILKLKSEQLKACEIIKNMIEIRNKANDEIAQLKKAKQALEKELENVVTKPQNEEREGVMPTTRMSQSQAAATPPNETPEMADEKLPHDDVDVEMVEQYKRLTSELEVKVEVLVATLKEKDNQMEYLRDQYNEILNVLEEKENKIVDLEFELLSIDQSKPDRSLSEKGDTGTEKRSSFYKQELNEKNCEIERLNGELKKCTCYLQEIVNTELWDKNRQIEKLQSKQDNTSEVTRLKKELAGKESQLKLLKDKICELGLDVHLPAEETFDCKTLSSPKRNIEHIKALQEQLRAAKEERNYFEKRAAELEKAEVALERLRTESDSVKAGLEKSEKLRQEVNDVCTILGNRLEELAIFLDSLLKQKSVLGFLGSAKNKRLREIINSSIDMSRSFTMSLMINPDQSLTQLTNITTLLNGSVFQELSANDDVEWEAETHFSIQPDNISLTYDSHLSKKADGNRPDQEQVIAVLREQVFKLKEELQVRDNELNRLNQGGSEGQSKESGVERLQDSEEERQNKSQQLTTPKSSTATVKAHQNEAHSESEAWSEPDRAVSRARIGLNRSVPAMGGADLRPDYCESTEEEDIHQGLTPTKRRSALLELSQEVYRLQRELDEKSEEIVASGVMYRQQLQSLERELQEGREKLLQVELEKSNALKKTEDIQKVLDELTAEKQLYLETMNGKDKEMQDRINQIEVEKQQLQLEAQTSVYQLSEAENKLVVTENKLKALEQQWNVKETELRKEYEAGVIEKLKKAEEAFAKQLKAAQEKCEAEVIVARDSLRRIEEEYSRDYVKKEEVDKKLQEAENVIKELAELKSVVNSYEQTLISFKDKERTFDRTIAQLDKDKLSLAGEVAKMADREKQLLSEMTEMARKYDEQVTTLQKQKSALELKISELESSNADLHNRLIKTQTTRFSLGLNATLPPNVGSKFYRRQYSEQNAYSSEEAGDELRSFTLSRSNQRVPIAAEAERAEANSSPDLGIESDQGRFSSLETNGNNVHRPLLPTIELTESLNNLFDGQHDDERQESDIANANPHCCQKSVEIAQENNELKRKLLRMKRALEETAAQLSLANQRKKQVEKTICKQIHKTSQVLRKAKANLDSGSESDVFHT